MPVAGRQRKTCGSVPDFEHRWLADSEKSVIEGEYRRPMGLLLPFKILYRNDKLGADEAIQIVRVNPEKKR